MKLKVHHSIIFLLITGFILALIIHPSIFNWYNRIEPWVFGLPFSTFWVIFWNLCICVTLIAWYYTDSVKGELDVDIEPATEEELNEWLRRGVK